MNSVQGGSQNRKWLFRVQITRKLLHNEVIGVTGDCDSLGNWRSGQTQLLQPEDDGKTVWKTAVYVPCDKSVAYRYFIGFFDQNNEVVLIRQWETHLNVRAIPHDAVKSTLDTFGDVRGLVKIDRGWLTTETVVQFKFFNNPFKLKNQLTDRLLFIKVTPQNLSEHFDSSRSNSLDSSMSNDTRGDEDQNDNSTHALTEVATLTNANFMFQPQEQFGAPYNKDDYILFNVTVTDPDNVVFLIDLYTYQSKGDVNDPPQHLGYHYILPTFLKSSDGKLEMGVTSPTNNRLLGMMKIEYVKITPLPDNARRCHMETSFVRHWNLDLTGLDVGHRGSGTSFKAIDGNIIRENTIASLTKAGISGADMVEFDVQLSKDLVPVIYHDFHVYVSLKRKKTMEKFDMLELDMRDLTLEQLKNLKVYHVVEGRSGEARFFDEHLDDHQPFPTLAETMDAIDDNVGFNIEVKSAIELFDGSKEADIVVDKNLYVNCILDVVLSKPIKRRIVFSSFDPDVCTMLRIKQNVYPVMFLTLGITKRYPSYHDPRCNTIESAVRNACAMEFLGIVAHTEDLLRDESQITYAKQQNLIVFCWGEDNNCKETIKRLKKLGLHAIIYDKMHVLSDKSTEENIFLVGAKESQNQLLEIQQMELEAKAAAGRGTSKKRSHDASSGSTTKSLCN